MASFLFAFWMAVPYYMDNSQFWRCIGHYWNIYTNPIIRWAMGCCAYQANAVEVSGNQFPGMYRIAKSFADMVGKPLP